MNFSSFFKLGGSRKNRRSRRFRGGEPSKGLPAPLPKMPGSMPKMPGSMPSMTAKKGGKRRYRGGSVNSRRV